MNNLFFSRHRLVSLLLMVAVVTGCTKSTAPPGTASITIINTVAGAGSISFSNTLTNAAITYNDSRRYQPITGAFPFKPHLRNEMDLTLSPDPLYQLTLNLSVGSISSLFLTGTLEKRDTLFVKDEPVIFSGKDSSMGLRFVNLSTGNGAISVNLQGLGSGSEVNSLSYKNLTAFKVYKANSTVSSYTFEFRDASSDALLATYTIENINSTGSDNAPNLWRGKNITLVFDGLPGSLDWPQTIFLVNNY